MRKPIPTPVAPSYDEPAAHAPLSECIQFTDEAIAVTRPIEIETFWIELEHEQAEAEQLAAYAEKAEEEARETEKAAGRLRHEADKAAAARDAADQEAKTARARRAAAQDALGPYVRRPADPKFMKYTRLALILGGDIAGISGLALLLGESAAERVHAGGHGAATAVTPGAVGREVHYMVSARAREKDPEDLSSDGSGRYYLRLIGCEQWPWPTSSSRTACPNGGPEPSATAKLVRSRPTTPPHTSGNRRVVIAFGASNHAVGSLRGT